jgi:hypothetical protein
MGKRVSGTCTKVTSLPPIRNSRQNGTPAGKAEPSGTFSHVRLLGCRKGKDVTDQADHPEGQIPAGRSRYISPGPKFPGYKTRLDWSAPPRVPARGGCTYATGSSTRLTRPNQPRRPICGTGSELLSLLSFREKGSCRYLWFSLAARAASLSSLLAWSSNSLALAACPSMSHSLAC